MDASRLLVLLFDFGEAESVGNPLDFVHFHRFTQRQFLAHVVNQLFVTLQKRRALLRVASQSELACLQVQWCNYEPDLPHHHCVCEQRTPLLNRKAKSLLSLEIEAILSEATDVDRIAFAV